MIDLHKYGKVSYIDFSNIIWKAGYKIADLNRFINKSHGYMDASGHSDGITKPKHILDLCNMIGEEMYVFCFDEVMKENEEKKKKRTRRFS